jgi:hypothetical protein
MSVTPNSLKNPVFGWKTWHKTHWDGGDQSPAASDYSKISSSPSGTSQVDLLDSSRDTIVSSLSLVSQKTF